jgi:inosine-uridine nucleoside N-ribohydrolase
MFRRITSACLFFLFALAITARAQPRRKVIIDQDGSGPGGSNQMSMMVLLQSSAAEVLGITMVSGNAWEPEEVQHTLRMLELIHRSDVPVVPGAIFPPFAQKRKRRSSGSSTVVFPGMEPGATSAQTRAVSRIMSPTSCRSLPKVNPAQSL